MFTGREMAVIDIRTDPEFEALIPKPTFDELDELEESLLHEGCRDNLVLWNDILLDGHNRFRICTQHGIKFGTSQADVKDREQAMLWIISNQLGRRNLTPFARTELVLKKKNILAGTAKEIKLSGKGKDGSGGRGKKKTSGMNSSRRFWDRHPTRATVAKAAELSPQTVQRVEALIDKAPAPVLEMLRKGEVSIHDAYKNLPRKSNGKSNGHAKEKPFRDLDDFAIRVSRRIGTILTQDDPTTNLSRTLLP